MNILATFEFTDYQELNDQQLCDAVKHLCDFDEVNEPYLVEIHAKSYSYEKRTIKYIVNIIDISVGV